MTIDVTEKQFEDLIEKTLLDSGYEKGTKNYDRKLAIDYEILIRFIQNSQKEKWDKLEEIHAETTRDEILRALEKALELESMIHSIRDSESILGSGIKEILDDEKELRLFATRSVQAITDISKGEILHEGINFEILRSGNCSRGAEPRFLEIINGKKSLKDIKKDEGITEYD